MKKDRHVRRKSKYQALKKLYETNITVESIAEYLVVCDIHEDALSMKTELVQRNYDVLGVQEGDEVIGYVERERLEEGTIRDFVRPFQTREIVSNSTPLMQFLHIFKERKRIFVLENNEVTQLITGADLQKPPVRMLIFGYITLLEMNLGELIYEKLPESSWKSLLSEGRLSKAEALFQERLAKDEDLHLIECLQISDKLHIVLNDPHLKGHFPVSSKSHGKRMANQVRDLRDRIAHSNELGMDMTWEEIIESLEICEEFLRVTERLLMEQ
ncbi:hypothetical protein J7E71_15800 [Mesobacillus foraminis]|uniref:hypothetical protein n=1 Tax=Mesobacillus foraminis TaxID=279826 RepID=UPI001BED1E1A|nr:hypothetical protein [Mesobacillus foraminis]MBT2757391.1 hypothetical protein [Mesobacillus foraminis]